MAAAPLNFGSCETLDSFAGISDEQLKAMDYTCLGSIKSTAMETLGKRMELVGLDSKDKVIGPLKFLNKFNLEKVTAVKYFTDEQIRAFDQSQWEEAEKPARIHWAERHACNALKGHIDENNEAFKKVCSDIINLVPKSTGVPPFAIALIVVLVLAVVGASLAYIFMRKRAAVDEEMKMSSFDEKKDTLHYAESEGAELNGSGAGQDKFVKKNPYEVTEPETAPAEEE